MIVADTNLVAYLLIDSTNTRTRNAFSRPTTSGAHPCSGAAICGTCSRGRSGKGDFELDAAIEVWRLAVTLFDGREFQPNGEHVLRLAASDCTAYDCEFVAVARDLDAPFVTFDRDVVRRFGEVAVEAKSFVRRRGGGTG